MDQLTKGLVLFGLFVGLSFMVAWVGMLWWVCQDVLARSRDKVILVISIALAAVFGPLGALLYLIIRPKQTIQEAQVEHLEREMMLHASASIVCPNCGRMAQTDFLACPHCGTALKYPCPNCAQLVQLEWEHCPYCSTGLPQRQHRTGSLAATLNQAATGQTANALRAGVQQTWNRLTQVAQTTNRAIGSGSRRSTEVVRRRLERQMDSSPRSQSAEAITDPNTTVKADETVDQLRVLDQAITRNREVNPTHTPNTTSTTPASAVTTDPMMPLVTAEHKTTPKRRPAKRRPIA